MTVLQKQADNPIAHLSDADIEQIGKELDAIRADVEALDGDAVTQELTNAAYLSGLENAEIAATLGISRGAVKSPQIRPSRRALAAVFVQAIPLFMRLVAIRWRLGARLATVHPSQTHPQGEHREHRQAHGSRFRRRPRRRVRPGQGPPVRRP